MGEVTTRSPVICKRVPELSWELCACALQATPGTPLSSHQAECVNTWRHNLPSPGRKVLGLSRHPEVGCAIWGFCLQNLNIYKVTVKTVGTGGFFPLLFRGVFNAWLCSLVWVLTAKVSLSIKVPVIFNSSEIVQKQIPDISQDRKGEHKSTNPVDWSQVPEPEWWLLSRGSYRSVPAGCPGEGRYRDSESGRGGGWGRSTCGGRTPACRSLPARPRGLPPALQALLLPEHFRASRGPELTEGTLPPVAAAEIHTQGRSWSCWCSRAVPLHPARRSSRPGCRVRPTSGEGVTLLEDLELDLSGPWVRARWRLWCVTSTWTLRLEQRELLI